MKALALDADAVYIGTSALLALAHTQLTKTIPWGPPTNLVFEIGPAKDRLAQKVGARSVYNYLRSCQLEMELALRTLGKSSLTELSKADLCALNPGSRPHDRCGEWGSTPPFLISIFQVVVYHGCH